MHHVGTVPMFNMHHVGTVPTFKTHHVGTLKKPKYVLNVPWVHGVVSEPKRNTGALKIVVLFSISQHCLLWMGYQ
jgi:hypothetical protein